MTQVVPAGAQRVVATTPAPATKLPAHIPVPTRLPERAQRLAVAHLPKTLPPLSGFSTGSAITSAPVVEMRDGRSRRVVERHLRALTEPQRRAIRVLLIDLYDACRQAIRNELP